MRARYSTVSANWVKTRTVVLGMACVSSKFDQRPESFASRPGVPPAGGSTPFMRRPRASASQVLRQRVHRNEPGRSHLNRLRNCVARENNGRFVRKSLPAPAVFVLQLSVTIRCLFVFDAIRRSPSESVARHRRTFPRCLRRWPRCPASPCPECRWGAGRSFSRAC